MRRFAYWLFPTIAIFVAVFIVALMIEVNPSSPRYSSKEEGLNDKDSIAHNDEESGWMNRLKPIKDKGYFYPINDVSIEMNPKDINSSPQRYRLMVHLNDSYEFFCLKQELKKTKLSYLLNQSEESLSVEIDSSDLISLNDLVSKLKTYQISATMSPLKKD
ncbi:MAG TPA: hypothetical protein VFX68_05250 [Sulfuricurvum sp.]|nr:hypothetical protein [Sulfuricurvum sp.]